MPNQSSDLNWKDSPAYISLLLAFEKPRDIRQVLEWDWPRQSLPEKPELAIERLVQEGMLIPANMEEGLNKLFQVTQLKKLLSERGLSVSGSKSELIMRLINHDHQGMAKILGNNVVKCSATAVKIINERKEKIETETEVARQKTFESFKNSNPKEACRIYESFRRQFIDSTYKISTYGVEELQFILISQPKILSSLTPKELRALQLAACMKSLWKTESLEKWLPESFTTPFKNVKIAINYLIRHANFQNSLSYYGKGERMKLRFHPGDIDSCNLCTVLDGKIFTIDTMPELPIPGCTSETGCLCDLQWADVDEEVDFEEEDADKGKADFPTNLADEILAFGENPIGALRLLKQMLDEGLITQSEFDEKKKEILDKM